MGRCPAASVATRLWLDEAATAFTLGRRQWRLEHEDPIPIDVGLEARLQGGFRRNPRLPGGTRGVGVTVSGGGKVTLRGAGRLTANAPCGFGGPIAAGVSHRTWGSTR
jgi:hypothetical protein